MMDTINNKALLLMLLMLMEVRYSQQYGVTDTCRLTHHDEKLKQIVLTCRDTSCNCTKCGQKIKSEVLDGSYVCDHKCSTRTEVIGLGVTVAFLSVMLVAVIVGWVWTCWILHKTTDFTIAIKPKGTNTPNMYEGASEQNNSTIFQPSTQYSLLTRHSYEDIPDYDGHETDKEEGLYEVLDRDEDKPSRKSTDKCIMVTGGNGVSYDTLEFKE